MPRQQTLRASVDWSHELLSDDERTLLRRLAVFAGGWTLDAVEQVCADEGLERLAILDLLASLVDKSLVTVDERGNCDALPAARDRAPVRARASQRGRRARRTARPPPRHLPRARRANRAAAPRRRAGRVAGRSRPRGREPRARDRSCRRNRRRARAATLYRADVLVEAPGQFRSRRRGYVRALDAPGAADSGLRARVLWAAATCSSTADATTRQWQVRARHSSARRRPATSRRPPARSTCSDRLHVPGPAERGRASSRPGNSRSKRGRLVLRRRHSDPREHSRHAGRPGAEPCWTRHSRSSSAGGYAEFGPGTGGARRLPQLEGRDERRSSSSSARSSFADEVGEPVSSRGLARLADAPASDRGEAREVLADSAR